MVPFNVSNHLGKLFYRSSDVIRTLRYMSDLNKYPSAGNGFLVQTTIWVAIPQTRSCYIHAEPYRSFREQIPPEFPRCTVSWISIRIDERVRNTLKPGLLMNANRWIVVLPCVEIQAFRPQTLR
jgi:hypothetical protein